MVGRTPAVSVIIPTLNEEKSIREVIERIPAEVRREAEIIVVDGLSSDGTIREAKKAGARVVRVRRRGKGLAMRVGAKLAKGEVLVFIDGDGSYPSGDIPRFVSLMGKVDLVLGNAMPYLKGVKSFGEKLIHCYPGFLISRFLFSLIGLDLDDPLNGMRAIRKKDFERLNLKSDGFEIETEMNIKARLLGLRMATIPVRLSRRLGRSKFIFDFGSHFRILCMILAVRGFFSTGINILKAHWK